MRHDQRVVTCRYMDELISLLDEERQTRDRPVSPELAGAIGDLRLKASHEGAGELTVSLIRAAEVALSRHKGAIGVDGRS